MDNKKLVSVLMSAYNSEDSISNAIESIVNQEYSEIELLIMDDGSSDNTTEICKEFSQKFNNIRLFKNEKNLGLTKSLNLLLKHSNGEIIARQDSDDVSFKSRIKEQEAFLKSNNFDACFTRALIKNKNKKIPGFSFYLPHGISIFYKNPFIHGTLFIKKSVINKLGNYDEKFIYAQDYRLFKDLIVQKYKIGVINKPLYELNMENNISTNHREEQNYYSQCVRKNIEPKK